MAYEQKPSDIAIFKEREKKSDRGPDWRGTLVTPNGERLSVALWAKNDGMLAGKVETPRERTDDRTATRDFRQGGPDGLPGDRHHGSREAYDLDDTIPF